MKQDRAAGDDQQEPRHIAPSNSVVLSPCFTRIFALSDWWRTSAVRAKAVNLLRDETLSCKYYIVYGSKI